MECQANLPALHFFLLLFFYCFRLSYCFGLKSSEAEFMQ
jgi:hypothetical protein